jgi:EmrB/QacA subfamily drug resistance transporter
MPSTAATAARNRISTLVIVSVGLFMVVLDNLVVTVALPSIHHDLHASMQSLEWTVNAYVLSYAALLLTGAALGDRFGRKRMFIFGVLLFIGASAADAVAPSMGFLIAARAVQGIGGAIVTPLTLTLLAQAFPPERRGLALGVWSGISGIAVALGPLVGGAVIQLSSWHWIFWINVPIGLLLAPTAARMLDESFGEEAHLDLPGVGLVSAGLFGIVFGLIRAQTLGWGATEVVIALVAGIILVVAFVIHELRTDAPMLPMEFFARRSFSVTNIVSLTMYFGMFGSIFFMSQYLQTVLHNTPFETGVKMLVWTGATLLVAPMAGYFSEKLGSRTFMVAGLALQAIALGWLALITSTHLAYTNMIVPFVFGGAGMALVFAPSANAILSSVRTQQAGQASGANNAIRELGGVLGIAVLSTVFTAHGSYASDQSYVNGLVPTMWVGAAVLAAGALIVLVLRFDTRAQSAAINSPQRTSAQPAAINITRSPGAQPSISGPTPASGPSRVSGPTPVSGSASAPTAA